MASGNLNLFLLIFTIQEQEEHAINGALVVHGKGFIPIC